MTFLTTEGGTTDAGNTGTSAGGAGSGDVGGAGGAGGGNAGGGAGSGAGAGSATSWRDTLPDDIKGNATLNKFNDIPSLAKSYIEMQGIIGKKGVFPPGDKATPEQWQSFFKSMGQPDLDKFEIKAPEGKKLVPEMADGFKKLAHENGLMPQQAQKLLDWYIGQEDAAQGARSTAAKTKAAEMQEGLKKEWGDGYDKQVALAKLAVKDVGGEDFAKYLESSGLGNDTQVIRLMSKVGALLGEDKLRGDGGGGSFGQTPAEIQGEIDKIRGQKDHPYFDSRHAGHQSAVKQMEGLYRKLSNKP